MSPTGWASRRRYSLWSDVENSTEFSSLDGGPMSDAAGVQAGGVDGNIAFLGKGDVSARPLDGQAGAGKVADRLNVMMVSNQLASSKNTAEFIAVARPCLAPTVNATT